MIDAGRHREALQQIEPQLADSRWQSSWLIRRARARLGLGDTAAARADLRSALDEIETRLHPVRPDLSLLVDRGLARALLGDAAAGREDLCLASSLRAEEWLRARLEDYLARQKNAARPKANRANETRPE